MSISMKRRIAALAFAATATLMFTGCASATEPASTSAPAASPTETVTETAPAETTEEPTEEAPELVAGEVFSFGGWDVTVSPFERGQEAAWNEAFAVYDEEFIQEMAIPDGYEAVKYTVTITRTADTPEINGAINSLLVAPDGEESYTATTDYEEVIVQPGETNTIWVLEVHPVEALDAGGFTYQVELLNTDTFAPEDVLTVAAQ